MPRVPESGRQDFTAVLEPREGYRILSSSYESWHWFEFWHRNESPIVRDWLASLEPGLFLDAGSGTGLYQSDLQRAGHRSISLDLSIEMLRSAQRKNREETRLPSLEFVQGDIQLLPFRDSAFDYLLCTRVLSHVRSVTPVLAEFARVLKRGAQLLISDVHPSHPYKWTTRKQNGVRVSIRTYKHPIEEFKREISAASFHLAKLRECGLRDLTWRPPRHGFEKIYDEPDRPIFYICWLKRT